MRVLWTFFWRSLFLQALWNFERMQNLGFFFCLYPQLRRLYPSGEAREAAFRRHLEFFNTHPYMANMLVGLVGAMEEKNAGQGGMEKEISALKSRMSGPVAALGDSFFWGAWRPFCILAWVANILLTGTVSLWPTLIVLVVYNTVPLLVRWEGLIKAYRQGTAVVEMLSCLQLQRWVRWIHLMGFVLVAVLVVAMIFQPPSSNRMQMLLTSLVIVFLGLLRFGISSTKIIYATVIGNVFVVWLRGVFF